jgi:NhaP-type Na+/H+ or K+/H+ antiporter
MRVSLFFFLAVSIICGVIFGPVCAQFIDVDSWENKDEVTKQFCRFVIGIQVMAAGVSLPKAYLRKEFVSILVLLGPVMIYMWLVSGLLVWGLIPGLNFVC